MYRKNPSPTDSALASRGRPTGTKPPSLAALSIPLPLLALVLSVPQAGCDNDEGAIRVRVHYAGAAPAPVLSNLALIAGDDKYDWPTLENGGTETVTLHANPRSERELVLLYTMAGQAKSWDGPRFGPGRQGYRIHLEIDGDGRISSRHCRLPCALDPPPTP